MKGWTEIAGASFSLNEPPARNGRPYDIGNLTRCSTRRVELLESGMLRQPVEENNAPQRGTKVLWKQP